jgi:hypothetical protein
MPSLSTGPLQKATRKAIASLLDSSPTLWNQFYSDKVIAIILREECGIDIDENTLSKAFASGGDTKYSLQLKDMGIGHEGEGILYVYKAYRLPDRSYITAFGRFESVAAAEAINLLVGRNTANTAIDEAVKGALEKHLEKEQAKKEKKKSTNKRPSSPSSEKPPPKKPPSGNEQTNNEDEELADADYTAVPTPESANTRVPAPTIATATPEEVVCETETVATEKDLKLIDTYIDLVKEKLNNSEEWKAEADEICKQAHNDYLNTVANDDDDDDNEVSGFRNLQPPVFTRWHSVLNGVLWLRKHYVLIYFMAVAIIQKEGSKSELYKTACDIVSLMSMRPNARSIVESGDVATAAAVEDDVATSRA